MLILTEKAIYRTPPGGAWPPRVCCPISNAVFVAEGTTTDVAITADNGLLLMQGQQQVVCDTAVPEAIQCVLILREAPLTLLIGTEDARLYRWQEPRTKAVRVVSFDDLACRPQWHTPWGGPPAVRSLATTPEGWVYADIHVGSIMRSCDQGESWEPVTPDVNEDVHQVATCPTAPDVVVANTARAVYVSGDRGESWQHRSDDLGNRYGRALAVHPTSEGFLLATVSDGPHGDNVHGQLYSSHDGGRSWTCACGEFPESTPGNIDTFKVAFAREGTPWAVVGSTLFRGSPDGVTWDTFWQADSRIVMISCSL